MKGESGRERSKGMKGGMKTGKMKTRRGGWREKIKFGGIEELNEKKRILKDMSLSQIRTLSSESIDSCH